MAEKHEGKATESSNGWMDLEIYSTTVTVIEHQWGNWEDGIEDLIIQRRTVR